MDIYKKIKTDIVAALRGKDKPVLTALRTLDAAILKIVKDKGREINDDLTVEVLKKSIKDIETSKTYAVDAGRQDLIDQADSEISILSEYLPQTLSEEETEAAVVEAISALGATTKKDMGKVMGYLKSKVGSQIDMSLTSKLVGSKLS